MNVFGKLFPGKAPFEKLVEHSRKGMECIIMIKPLLQAAFDGDDAKVKELAKTVFVLEHEADLIKNEIRDSLHKSILLPVARGDFLSMLKQQDALPDKVEDLAMLLTIRPFTFPKSCKIDETKEQIFRIADLAVEAATLVSQIMEKMQELKEFAFSGQIANDLLEVAEKVGELETQSDKRQFKILQNVLGVNQVDDHYADLYILLKVVGVLGKLANHAESTCDYLRLMIAE